MTTDEHAGNPFAVAGRWYRGNLHTHSTNSDGRKSVEDAVGWYRDNGYDFMALTDHRVLSDTSALTTDDFITIPGMEMHGPDPWLGVNYHIVGLGMHSFERSDEAWGPQEAIDRVNADGGMAILAHPYWLGQTAADMSELEGFAGMEVFNSITDRDRAKGLSAVHWDDYGDTLGITWGFATDDTHWFLNEEGRGWVMVRTTDFSQRGLLEAMRAGHFYASMGPELHDVQISATHVRVCCSPARRVTLITARSGGTSRHADGGDLLTDVTFERRQAPAYPERYIRVEVEDAEGRVAWSNPRPA